MTPLWRVSDMQFLASAGFDSFVSVRVIAYGIALFLPLTIFGIGVCKLYVSLQTSIGYLLNIVIYYPLLCFYV